VFDPVPWFVGGGAQHSPEVARLLAYAATGGSEGVVLPGDLKVTATTTPGGTVSVAPGGVLVLNRAIGGTAQTYVGRMVTADTVSISPTTSSGARTDLIVAQIEDPFMTGEPWQDPADPTVGPYIFTRVISNVPSTATRLQDVSGYEGRSAVTLARVTLPANTATVTNAMITDLRSLARPRSQRNVYSGTLPASNRSITLSGGWSNFPNAPISGIDIPAWATHMIMRVETTYTTVFGNDYFYMQSFFGTDNPYGQIANITIDGTSTSKSRSPILNATSSPWAIPAALRGTTQALTTRVRAAGATGGVISTNASDYYIADITFMEAAA
jgi:hypothetical protein